MVTGYYPTTQKEALEEKSMYPDALLISGGTDAMVVKKKAEHIIFLNNVKDMQSVEENSKSILIGAGCCYTDLIANPIVPEMLKKAMRNIASPAIRSAGTLAGNICNASPAGDTLPVLYALNASVMIASWQNGSVVNRKVLVKDFILGIRKIDLKENELVVAIEIPKEFLEKDPLIYYEKVGARKAEAISKLSFVGACALKDGHVEDIRIAFGSVGITALRFLDLEERMKGKSLSEIEALKPEIIEAYMERIHPIDDQRSTAAYRRQVCRNLLGDFFAARWEEACYLSETATYIQDQRKAG